MNCETYHIPVMLQQTVDGLDIRPGGTYVDLTFGGGGHSREILRRLGDDGRLFGFDQDLDAMKGALQDPRFIFVRSNFRFLKNWMRYYEVERVDGILADLGVSSHHLDDAARGFSFRQDAPLDMRMNQKAKCSARTVLRDYTEEQLASVLYLYGELKNSRRLASTIVKARAQGEIMTTGQLAALLQPLLPRDREKKDLARVFQALRIEALGAHLSLAGGPHGQECDEERKRGGQAGDRRVWPKPCAHEAAEQQAADSHRAGTGREPAQPLGQVEGGCEVGRRR